MISADVLIVGGGPAGASCAWRLRRHGIDCLVLDRAAFPRSKLCAGWITPKVVRDLAIEPGEYPHGFLTFPALRFSLWGRRFTLPTIQHSIRRIEFDDWLLKRSGAPVVRHNVKTIRAEGDGYVIDETWRCRRLVGAGGTRCPVYRTLFRDTAPRPEANRIVVLEEEFAFAWQDDSCYLWFFDEGLPGYGWYVPKAGGHINVGVGGMAAGLHARGGTIRAHWQHLTRRLDRRALVPSRAYDPGGYTYHLAAPGRRLRHGNAFIVGDAAGLATGDMGEGIGPAIESGLLAADAMAGRAAYEPRRFTRYSLPGLLRENPLVARAVRRLGRSGAAPNAGSGATIG